MELEALDRLQRGWVLELLDELTPIQRDVLALRFVVGLGTREVAEITGSTETAVKANQRRAVGALRRHIERAGSVGAASRAARELVDLLGVRS